MQESSKIVELIESRLRILEEEDECLKGEIVKIMKERSELISEVRQCFKDIHCNLQCTNKESGKFYSQGSLAIEPYKDDRKTGLLQALCLESNPLLLRRGPGRAPSAQAIVTQNSA